MSLLRGLGESGGDPGCAETAWVQILTLFLQKVHWLGPPGSQFPHPAVGDTIFTIGHLAKLSTGSII